MTSELRSLDLDARQEADFELLANGGFAPLRGFQGSADWESVVEKMRLATGEPWPIPITLGSGLDVAEGEVVELRDRDGGRLGELRVEEIYERDLRREAREVYGTDEEAHPGVAALYAEPARTLAGPITPSALPDHQDFVKPHLYTPEESRAAFRERGWKTVVGFQTRNPIHRAHEYLTKAALETVDGLFLHPLVGETKPGDIPAEVRVRCYEILIDRYYNDEHVLLGVYPAAMRYAGPREAVLHALARRNYGCTHFIVGRDHAGVGDYYETYAAQEVFSEFTVAELGIEPMMFEHAFWCTVTKAMASAKTSPSGPEERVFLSGTAVREMLGRGERPPEEFTRPEVADVLIDSYASAEAPA